MNKLMHLSMLLVLLLGACQPEPEPPLMIVSLVVDGRSLTYDFREPITVAEFLAQVNVTYTESDRIVPPPFTQISDGLQVTVRRVTEETECQERDIPYRPRTVIDERLEPGTEMVAQAGQNGREQQCYRIRVVDGIRGEPDPIGDPIVLKEPVAEIVYIAPSTQLDPVEIRGTLAYVSGGNAWVMRGSSDTRHPVTNTGDIDPARAFSLSADGRQLLFARTTADDGEFGNQLYMIPDVNSPNPQPAELRPTNVLWADWVPGRSATVSYSTAEPRDTSPGWGASNDLWLTTLDLQTGVEIEIDPVIEPSPGRGGPFSWWGRVYAWSPSGNALAWVHANAVGTVNLQTGELNEPLVTYAPFTPRADWSWRSSVSWSPDDRLLLSVVHGPAIGSESDERSPVFDVGVIAVDGSFEGTLVERSGIWAFPRFSPAFADGVAGLPTIAYFKARQPLTSVPDSSEYDLYVADADGSNATRIFPGEEGQRGITERDFTWSPDGQHVAVIYQGNLWVVDVRSGVADQVTLDGTASHPVWSR